MRDDYTGSERRLTTNGERIAWRHSHLQRFRLKELWPVILFVAGALTTVLGTAVTMRQDIALLRQDLAKFHDDYNAITVAVVNLERRLEITNERVSQLNRSVGVMEERTKKMTVAN